MKNILRTGASLKTGQNSVEFYGMSDMAGLSVRSTHLIINPYHDGYFIHYTPSQFLSNWIAGFQSLACICKQVENSVFPDQLASEKPADLDLHWFKYRKYQGLAE